MIFSQKWQTISDDHPITPTQTIIQDNYGVIWIGTRDGLIGYNGYDFEDYPSGKDTIGLQGSTIMCLHVDQKNQIWVGTKQIEFLQVLDRNKRTFQKYYFIDTTSNQPLGILDIYSIAEDLDGIFWVGTSRGLFRFDPETDHQITQVLKYDKNDLYSIDDNNPWRLYVDDQNTLWIGTLNGLNRFDRSTQRFINRNNNPNYLEGQILTIKQHPSSELWVSGRHTPDRIYRYLPESDSFESVFDFPDSTGNYFNFDFKPDGSCWVASRSFGGLKLSADQSEMEYFDGFNGEFSGLTEYRGQIIFVDRFENVWIGGSRLSKFPSSNKNFKHIRGNSYMVLSILDIGDQIIYGLNEPFIWDKHTKQSSPFWSFGPVKNVRSNVKRNRYPKLIYEIKRYDENTIHFTTNRSVWVYDMKTKQALQYPQDAGGLFLDFVYGDEGQLWISEGNNYIQRFDFQTGKTSLAKTGQIAKALYCTTTTKDQSGKIWFGQNVGRIFRYDDRVDSIDVINMEMTKKNDYVRASRANEILAYHDGSIWVATNNGLWHLNQNLIFDQHLDISDGLSSNAVKSIIEDVNGDLWLGMSNGLSRFQIDEKKITNFNQSDGLINTGFGNSVVATGGNGVLYFGGNGGIDMFHPDEIDINDISPQLFIKDVLVNGQQYESDTTFFEMRELILDHDENYVDIQMVAIHLTAPLSNQYQFRINERQWVDNLTNRNITLSNLSPGDYRIQAKSSNADGVWSDEKTLLQLRIRPPWWRTWWFYSACIFIGLVIIYLIYRFRVKQVKKEEALQTEFNKKIAEIEMKALRAQMNPHFLFNSLNSVKSLISKKENVLATQYLTQFSKLIRRILNNSRKKFVRLNDEIEALDLYLQLESMRFAGSFEYVIDVADNVNSDFLEVPPMILQPFVENAIWHGLMHKTEGPRIVTISISRDDDIVRMIVEDNGIGREAAKKLQTRSSSKQDSLGIKITEDRLALIKDIYGADASIEIQDLKDNDGVACGTRIEVLLPIPE